jgi:2-dehydro-3-deoxyphosphogluconate aldolase / (4S)-4-hydroxy-2-oxoglutarate aldolase
MDQYQQIEKAIKAQIILPLFYQDDENTCIAIAEALYAGGIRAIEFTNRGKNALANFKVLVAKKGKLEGLYVGVGTITTAEQATQFIEAGADFLISPVFDAHVADTAYLHKIPWLPGCMTPTEIHIAAAAGCSLIKLFPGNVLGPSFVQAIKPLFPKIHFVVTGGVEASKEGVELWMKAGVVGVGLGSKFITEDIIAKKKFEELTKQTATLLQLLK